MAELVWAIIFGVLAFISLLISIMQFNEKGFLFNNAYIWESKENRQVMNKKPHYRQSAVAFAIVAVALFVMALECVLQTLWLWLVIFALSVTLLIYSLTATEKCGII